MTAMSNFFSLEFATFKFNAKFSIFFPQNFRHFVFGARSRLKKGRSGPDPGDQTPGFCHLIFFVMTTRDNSSST